MRPSKPMILVPLAVICLLPLLSAQQEQGVSGVAPPKPGTESRVSVQFKGGTLKDFVQAIRAAAEDINIVLPEKADKVVLPPITLKNAAVIGALEAATTVIDRDEYQISVKAFHGSGGASVYAVRVDGPRTTQSIGPGGMVTGTTRVLSLRNITEAPPLLPPDASLVMSAETALTAVKAGLTLAGLTPQLKYHTESGLLFVQGPEAASNLVSNIIRQIEVDLTQRRSQTPPGTQPAKKAAEGK
jgi:hypothetical protein